ncbi:MAG TPA: NAD-dependent epimerase/dehydratase family protein [Tenuifilaceae bacterium]|nr:NAD-dependent epimerase/dehydratase family protein [Tenuifilaceae bacterium]HOZ14488.1 NAD-dependent epimerase/dehydratase family protein [Tenuifilaceae bacterium]HPI45314.1 NAD-dependent epimerase/dehydratase family protein [Tenuifilaceae bacterium]HPN22773.1 NAD-dependent epimerase/dehydratase family protein [Tenuifilaceae bacterium]
MIKVGITGQSGFIGTHLFNTLGLYPDKFERVPFEDTFFDNKLKLSEFVRGCDVIVHLAAMNRHNSPEVIYSTNIGLVQKLIEACEITKSTPHIIFSSSTQEERDNLYGKSKKEGRILFEQWASKNNAIFSGFVIPNVFGPFGKPYYNSVVATFCHQLTHGEEPKIEVDGELNLIYVSELVNHFIEKIVFHSVTQSKNSELRGEAIQIPHTATIKVSSLLNKLNEFKANYFEKGVFPNLTDSFERNLFNTFVCYIDHNQFFPFRLELKTDDRGSFVETIKLNSGGQISFSTTKPGITRGNHFHTRKSERFAVIKGKAIIEIRRVGTDKKITFELDGSNPSFVDMPIWFTHNIKNIGSEDLYTIFWISEHFNANDPDTFFETV